MRHIVYPDDPAGVLRRLRPECLPVERRKIRLRPAVFPGDSPWAFSG
jgi:hypothetical protein